MATTSAKAPGACRPPANRRVHRFVYNQLPGRVVFGAGAIEELPREIDPPVVDRVDPDATPILAVLVAGPASIRTLSELADKRIKPRLERVAGVRSCQEVPAQGDVAALARSVRAHL